MYAALRSPYCDLFSLDVVFRIGVLVDDAPPIEYIEFVSIENVDVNWSYKLL